MAETVLAICVFILAVGVACFAGIAVDAKTDVKNARVREAELVTEVTQLKATVKAEQAAGTEGLGRLKAEIDLLRKQLAEKEATLAAERDPQVLLERLRQLGTLKAPPKKGPA